MKMESGGLSMTRSVGTQAGADLHFGPKINGDRYGLHQYPIVRQHRRHLESTVAKYERAGRNFELTSRGRKVQRHPCIFSGLQNAVGIIRKEFHQQRIRFVADGARSGDQARRKTPSLDIPAK